MAAGIWGSFLPLVLSSHFSDEVRSDAWQLNLVLGAGLSSRSIRLFVYPWYAMLEYQLQYAANSACQIIFIKNTIYRVSTQRGPMAKS